MDILWLTTFIRLVWLGDDIRILKIKLKGKNYGYYCGIFTEFPLLAITEKSDICVNREINMRLWSNF